ncbi:RrF2 family transcriptional regulator [Syntrophotalea acetylenica]|uniref:RrF2 family transcriptional regulator n=1 Tax=Syntrophotalea acetylenica TaxID=29542 RepID=UPI0009F9B851|nr:Rrf2 family transcriptional regulator [Syntrophotalea acetylenica]
MIITRATEYAIRAVLFMAAKPREEIVLKKDICREQDITPAFLTKVLQPLIKEGIVGSHRGVGGGFFLAKNPTDITLLDVIRAEEGPIYLNLCLADKTSCERESTCPVNRVWQKARAGLVDVLGSYSFAQLLEMEPSRENSGASETGKTGHFSHGPHGSATGLDSRPGRND